MTRFENDGVFIQEKVWLKNSLSQQEGGWQCRGRSEYRNKLWRVTSHMDARGTYVKEIGRVSGWATGWQRANYCVLGGCLLSLSLCRRDFQYFLKVRPSSLLMCGCISSSSDLWLRMSLRRKPLFKSSCVWGLSGLAAQAWTTAQEDPYSWKIVFWL